MSLTKTKPTSGISSPTSSPEGGSSCVIAGGTKIEGNFQSAENVRLDGTIVGDFSCDKKLVVGKEGTVDGNIRARDAVILGTVKGDMTISGLLHLERSAHITGNIIAGSLNVEEGARYDGHCKVG